MKKSLQEQQEKVTKGILKSFESKFGTKEKPVEFETIWPISKWDTIQTETRTFSVELVLSTGKVKEITEEF